MNYVVQIFRVALLWTFLVETADAYIGPGVGITAIGSLIAFILAVLVALWAFIWFPLRRLFNKNKPKLGDHEDFDTDIPGPSNPSERKNCRQ